MMTTLKYYKQCALKNSFYLPLIKLSIEVLKTLPGYDEMIEKVNQLIEVLKK